MALTCHCTSQGCGEMGGREVDYRTQKLHAQKDKAHLVKRLPERMNMLSRTSLSQSGSILLQPHLWMMYFHLHQLLFQVDGCGLLHSESLFLTQAISQQLIHLPIENSSIIFSVNWVKSSLPWIHCQRHLIQNFSAWICCYSSTPPFLYFIHSSNITMLRLWTICQS
jgi:hypothetical protein